VKDMARNESSNVVSENTQESVLGEREKATILDVHRRATGIRRTGQRRPSFC